MQPATDTIEEVILQTAATGAPVRLEHVRGHLKVEASPTSLHQITSRQIERSIGPIPGQENGCACFGLADTLIRFPDADRSLKRPDIAIFCTQPPAIDEALEVLPEAVIEILSVGYEEKDLGPDGAQFYLECGIADVLICDPRGKRVLYYQAGEQGPVELNMPATVDLQCGCRVVLA